MPRQSMRFARAHTLGKHVSFDINYRAPLWNGNKEKALREVASVLPYVDFLKLSDEELDFVGGCDQIPLCMEQYGISLLVVTLGARGQTHICADGRRRSI